MLMCIKLTVMSQLPQAKLVSSFFSCNYSNNDNKILNNAKEKLIQCRQKKEGKTWKTPSRGKCALNLSCLPFPANSEKKLGQWKWISFLQGERGKWETTKIMRRQGCKHVDKIIKFFTGSQWFSRTVYNVANFQQCCHFSNTSLSFFQFLCFLLLQ